MHEHLRNLVRHFTLADGTPVTLRPIRPADAQIEQQFVRGLSAEARYFRFMENLKELTPSMLRQFTEPDYDRHVALIAVTPVEGGEIEIAVGRYVMLENSEDCEFAIVVADEWQRKGIAKQLMQTLIDSARARGLKQMTGDVLAGNRKMLDFATRLGFRFAIDHNDPRQIRATLDLQRA